MTSNTHQSISTLYNLIAVECDTLSKSPLFLVGQFATSINQGTTQLRLFVRSDAVTDPIPPTPELFTALQDFCNPFAATTPEALGKADTASKIIEDLKERLVSIYAILRGITTGSWRQDGRLWKGKLCPSSAELVAAAEEFCREVRGLGDFSRDIRKLIPGAHINGSE
ncbi:hypothetical protein BDV97DRAFT_400861 [Delphinella strobiligena]|nr:hypothetical protein BDV97DRAFT_400861 [Delphinella strobiligena]